MEKLFQLIFFSFKQFYSSFKNGYLCMPITTDKLKVLRIPIILLILNAPRRILGVFMMDYLPRMKASAQCLCYYKAVFHNKPALHRHRIKEIIRVNSNPIVSPVFNSTAFPSPMFFANKVMMSFKSCFCYLRELRTTRATNIISSLTVNFSNPSFFPAKDASVPDIISIRATSLLFPISISDFWHNYSPNTIIPLNSGEYNA